MDVSMAYKFHLRDYDLTTMRVHAITDTIIQGFTASGGKKPRPGQMPEQIARKDNYKDEDEIPLIRDIIAQSMSSQQGTVIME